MSSVCYQDLKYYCLRFFFKSLKFHWKDNASRWHGSDFLKTSAQNQHAYYVCIPHAFFKLTLAHSMFFHWLQDYTSLFPLDDTQPSKLMRLLSSNEDENSMLSSPGHILPASPTKTALIWYNAQHCARTSLLGLICYWYLLVNQEIAHFVCCKKTRICCSNFKLLVLLKNPHKYATWLVSV